MNRQENRVPPVGSTVILRDGSRAIVVCGWYAKGQGGWKVLVDTGNGRALKLGLREFKREP